MAITLFPDFEYNNRIGDRTVVETTLQYTDGRPAWIVTNVIFVPAGHDKGRSVIFIDDGPIKYVEQNE